jgi:hypothetical protein
MNKKDMVFGNKISTVKRVNLVASEAGQLRGLLLNDATEKQSFFLLLIQILQSITFNYYQATKVFFLSVMVS